MTLIPWPWRLNAQSNFELDWCDLNCAVDSLSGALSKLHSRPSTLPPKEQADALAHARAVHALTAHAFALAGRLVHRLETES